MNVCLGGLGRRCHNDPFLSAHFPMNAKLLGTAVCFSLMTLAGCGDRATSDPQVNSQAPASAENTAPSPDETKEVVREPETDNLLLGWATRARNARIENKTLANVSVNGKTTPVIYTGTLSSWAGENIDTFATRAARYMRTMSSVTGKAYCGQICSADGKAAGPFAVDIVTTHQNNACAPIDVCSLPNGSGLERFGQSTSQVVIVNAQPQLMNPQDDKGAPSMMAAQFTKLNEKGEPDGVGPEKGTQYYFLKTYNDLLHLGQDGKVREVYDFAVETRPASIANNAQSK